MRFLLPALVSAQMLGAVAFASNIINLSHYDTVHPDFAAMTERGVKAAIHEATFPVGSTDEKYAVRQNAALKAGLLWGAYHFADATNPIRQADRFVEMVAAEWKRSPHTGSSPGVVMVLDFEKNHYGGGTMRIDQAVIFIKRVRERTGKYPGIYSGEYRIRDVINKPSVSASAKDALRSTWLWIANYHHRPISTKPWSSWSLWQYCGDGVCDFPRSSHPIGMANLHHAELSFFNGRASSVRSFWEQHAWNPASRSSK